MPKGWKGDQKSKTICNKIAKSSPFFSAFKPPSCYEVRMFHCVQGAQDVGVERISNSLKKHVSNSWCFL